jgi:hypothetical protein
MSLWRKRQIAEKVKEMSYQDALIAAGANVIAFQEFGDWQGSWVALVEYKGERGWVQGSYGSCDHCDAFEAEFGWDAEEEDDYEQRLASFGESYMGGLQTTQQVLSQFERSSEWDLDAEDAIFWIRETQQTYGVE